MQGQVITPWSIYDQTLRPHNKRLKEIGQQSPFLPKLNIPLMQKQRPEVEQNSARSRQSARSICMQLKPIKPVFVPYTFNLKHQHSKQEEIEKRSIEIEHSLQKIMILRLIKEDLKAQSSQINFMRLLKQVYEQPKQLPLPTLEVQKNRSFLLDRRVFPRVNLQKNMMIVNVKQESSQEGSLIKRKESSVQQILKNEINSMISNRMKIMSKTKEITEKM